jgi:hypothetical protein
MLWVDNECYVGPCRRQSRQRFRLFNRRERGDCEEAPSTQKLLRQLTVTNLSLAGAGEQRHFRFRLQAALDLAAARRQHHCRAELALLLELYDAASTPREIAEEAAAAINRALTSLRN